MLSKENGEMKKLRCVNCRTVLIEESKKYTIPSSEPIISVSCHKCGTKHKVNLETVEIWEDVR